MISRQRFHDALDRPIRNLVIGVGFIDVGLKISLPGRLDGIAHCGFVKANIGISVTAAIITVENLGE